MSVVSVRNLSKSYGTVQAVDDLSLDIEEGMVMGLIGPNGAGKTTTIKLLLGLLRPDEGSISVFGEDPWDNPTVKSRIGVIHERANFPPHDRVSDYLRRTCRIFGVPESEAQEAVEMVDLQEAYERPIGKLSAGMLQKFAIAHALVHGPELVVADEPTSNLDPEARNDLLNLIIHLNRSDGTTFLISSHILPELSNVCGSVAIMNRGSMWAQGSIEELGSRFNIGVTRVSTKQPELLAHRVRELAYVERAEIDAKGLSVHVSRGADQDLYEDVLRIAKEAGARVTGIETGTSSLEELFRLATREGGNGKTEEDPE